MNEQKELLVVRLQDPASGQSYFFPPGGMLEASERPISCAERETREETGYRVRCLPDSESRTEYEFTWNLKTYVCHTYWFAAQYQGRIFEFIRGDDANYNHGPQWVKISEWQESMKLYPEIIGPVLRQIDFLKQL